MDSKKRRHVKKTEAPPSGDGKKKTPPKRHRYNLRDRAARKVPDEDEVRWVDDDVCSEDDEDSDYVPPKEDEEDEDTHISVPANVPVTVKIHLHTFVDEDEDEEESDEDESEDEDAYNDFLMSLIDKYGSKRDRAEAPFFILTDETSNKKKDGRTPTKRIEPVMKLNREERGFFEELPRKKAREFNEKMEDVRKHLTDAETPFKFQILDMPLPASVKASVIKKVDAIHRMGLDSGEAHKLKTWVDSFLRIPFGKQIPLPVSLSAGAEPCSKFLTETREVLDRAVYGMGAAKTQILQILAQWIANPSSAGNVIALKGPMGVGKTSFARNGIAAALKRPFQFFSLGGASDVAHYVGHSYTYEGSTWGRIVDAILQAGCMNPVIYFDELDKVSGTPHGEEIISMLIHLTDRAQNMQYHDRYFAGIDFDLSQCLFVFSFNDESKVHPVLKDRMTVIQCAGYNDEEKKMILSKYVWPEMLTRFNFAPTDLEVTEDAVKRAIKEFSAGEEGMRNLIRAVETLIMRINLLRISDKNDPATKALKFYMDIQFPFTITAAITEKLLADIVPPAPQTPFGMYV